MSKGTLDRKRPPESSPIGPEPLSQTYPGSSNRKPLFLLLTNAKPYAKQYGWGYFFLLATNAFTLAIPWCLKKGIDTLRGESTASEAIPFALGIIGLSLALAMVRIPSRLLLLGASRQVVFDIRNRLLAHLQSLDGRFFDRYRTGDIMSRAINDLQLLRSFYGPASMYMLNAMFLYVGIVVLLLSIHIPLTAMALVLYPFLFLFMHKMMHQVFRRSKEIQEQLATISSHVQENINGVQQIRIFNQESTEIDAFNERCDNYRTQSLTLARLRAWMQSVIALASGIAVIAVVFVGGRLVISGTITEGDFVAFTLYLGMLVGPTVNLGRIINVIQRSLGALSRIDEFFQVSPTSVAEDHNGKPHQKMKGSLTLKDLTFRYDDRESVDDGKETRRPSLSHVSLEIPAGQKVALVGPLGSGKSTLARILLRFYPVERGCVFIDDIDLNDWPVDAIRSQITCVPQEAFLFSSTLKENVLFGRGDASDLEYERSLEIAHLKDALEDLPERDLTIVGERGYTLSGGQRQRTTVARATIADPRILILDDALASVDAHTEREILTELESHFRGRTVFVITHRLSALEHVDRILVFDEGHLVDDGIHEDLLQRSPLYRSLWQKGDDEDV